MEIIDTQIDQGNGNNDDDTTDQVINTNLPDTMKALGLRRTVAYVQDAANNRQRKSGAERMAEVRKRERATGISNFTRPVPTVCHPMLSVAAKELKNGRTLFDGLIEVIRDRARVSIDAGSTLEGEHVLPAAAFPFFAKVAEKVDAGMTATEAIEAVTCAATSDAIQRQQRTSSAQVTPQSQNQLSPVDGENPTKGFLERGIISIGRHMQKNSAGWMILLPPILIYVISATITSLT